MLEKQAFVTKSSADLVDGVQDDHTHGRDRDTHELRDFSISQKARDSVKFKPGKRSLVGLAAGCDHCHQCAKDAASRNSEFIAPDHILTVTASWATLVADA